MILFLLFSEADKEDPSLCSSITRDTCTYGMSLDSIRSKECHFTVDMSHEERFTGVHSAYGSEIGVYVANGSFRSENGKRYDFGK